MLILESHAQKSKTSSTKAKFSVGLRLPSKPKPLALYVQYDVEIIDDSNPKNKLKTKEEEIIHSQ